MKKLQLIGISLIVLFSTINLKATNLVFLSHTHYKYKTTHKIFANIVSAFGRKKDNIRIEININKSEHIIAYYDVKEQLIVINETLYDLCAGFKQDSLNALAMVIGHELAHHFENLPEQEDILYWNKGVLKSLNDKTNRMGSILIESRADFIGGYYAYIAGYKSYNIAAKLYEAVYNKYTIPEQNDGYPSKSERKAYARTAMNDLKKDIVVFETGEMLMLSGHYAEAASSYKFLFPIFPSREIANNVATALLLDAINKNSKELKYKVSIELDPYTRMYGAKSKNGYQSRDLNSEIIIEAIKYLKVSINLDTAYIPAYINTCSAFYLLGNIDSAKYYLPNTLKDIEPDMLKMQSGIQTLKALIAISEGNSKKAEEYFVLALKTYNNPVSNYNFKVFFDKKTEDKFGIFIENKASETNKELIDSQLKRIDNFNSLQVSENPFLLLKFKVGSNENYINLINDNFNLKSITKSEFLSVKEYGNLLSDKSFLYEYGTANGFYRVFNNKLLYFNPKNRFVKRMMFYCQ